MDERYDFGGWATRNNLKCSDGRTILRDAFKDNDGKNVPLVWNHQHNDPSNVLGHALLENRDEGVYAYCRFNETEAGKNAKLLVEHGDIVALSICANQLKHQGANVLHGAIREVSLVLAGANPGAFIDALLTHGDGASDEEGIIYTGESISLAHAAAAEEKTEEKAEPPAGEETVADVFGTLTDKQKTVVYALMDEVVNHIDMAGDEKEEGENGEMKHNVFDKPDEEEVLMHTQLAAVITDVKRYGSLKESAIAHGIDNIEYLFPDAQNMTNTPQFIQRDMGWVHKVMSGVHHTPFSRIKSVFADITADEARAKGYIKGKKKLEEVFTLLKRTTMPTTIYKKQKLDRDDVVDITDFDVVAWLKSEMRMMLDEEIARAVLVGDGRLSSSDDKINEQNIRPIWTDDELYTIKATATVAPNATLDEIGKAFIHATIRARKNYKGSGEPTLYTTEDMLTDCLLMEDGMGRLMYESVEKLAKVLRVKEIVAVPVMENLTRNDGGKALSLAGIIVNLADYNIGADKGGAVNMFDDFDIDYNAQKYLIETRCSGALTKPFSAVAVEITTNNG